MELTPDLPPDDVAGEPIRLPRWLNIVLGLFSFVAATAAGIWTDELANVKPWMFAIAIATGLVSLFGRPLVRG